MEFVFFFSLTVKILSFPFISSRFPASNYDSVPRKHVLSSPLWRRSTKSPGHKQCELPGRGRSPFSTLSGLWFPGFGLGVAPYKKGGVLCEHPETKR